MQMQLRIARPVTSLERSAAMYCEGLALAVIDCFVDHQGFDGVMLGRPELPYHFEFSFCREHPVAPSPTPEDLIVVYLPDSIQWQRQCAAMLTAGFAEVRSFNPYWQQCGRTFEDHDGYRVVLQQAQWNSRALAAAVPT